MHDQGRLFGSSAGAEGISNRSLEVDALAPEAEPPKARRLTCEGKPMPEPGEWVEELGRHYDPAKWPLFGTFPLPKSTEEAKGFPGFGSLTGMYHRTQSKKDVNYSRYGGRGITVCEDWSRQTYQCLCRLLCSKGMGPRPTPSHTIDRIDTDGNYEYGNVRWVLQKDQYRTKSTARLFEWKGERLLLREIWDMEPHETNHRVFWWRVVRGGWAIPLALSTPKLHTTAGSRSRIFSSDQEDEIAQLVNSGLPYCIIAKRYGCNRATVKNVWLRRTKSRFTGSAPDLTLPSR